MDTLFLARLQFAVTTIYHFFFVPLTIGLGILRRNVSIESPSSVPSMSNKIALGIESSLQTRRVFETLRVLS